MNSLQSKKKKTKTLSSTHSLAEEIKKFRAAKNQIKKIFKDFKKSFNYLSNDENIQSEAKKFDIPSQIPVEIENKTRTVTDRELSLIVMGQSHYAKSVLVNEIFKKRIMPLTYENPDAPWKMIKFHYGIKTITSLCEFDNAFDLGDRTNLLNQQDCISEEVLIDYAAKEEDAAFENSYVDVMHCSDILYEGLKVLVTPSSRKKAIEEVKAINQGHLTDLLPIIVYGFEFNELSPWDKTELEELRELLVDIPILFVKVPPQCQYTLLPDSYRFTRDELTVLLKTDQPAHSHHPGAPTCYPSMPINTVADMKLFGTLCQLNLVSTVSNGFFSLPRIPKIDALSLSDIKVDSDLVTQFDILFDRLVQFCSNCGRRYLVNVLCGITKFACEALKLLILQVYDLSYVNQITPKRLEFVKHQESLLFTSLLSRTTDKQDEICSLISNMVDELKLELPQEAAEEIDMSGFRDCLITTKTYKAASNLVREYIVERVNSSLSKELFNSMDVLRNSFIGTLERTLVSLNKQESENVAAVQALHKVIRFTYELNIPINSHSNFMTNFVEKIKQLIYRLPWQPVPSLDSTWVQKTASDMLGSVSEARLANDVIHRITDSLRQSHEAFLLAVKRLESRIEIRQSKYNEMQERIKRLYTPRFARLYLEGMSLRDGVLYSIPRLGRELGRGQYGVVYACSQWGSYNQMAVKSVVPPDDKHWSDLAMEFFYCKQMPEHDRIATIHGSVIDYSYSYGSSPVILFIMDRMARDFYGAIKQGLDWVNRLQVSLDVVEGLRFLHSQGLIHRDIKLKNVLLDYNNRGRLTDLGFCKPCAMLSGSLVGTPIHMAPELFNQEYNFSVDIYAFGILFWYVCSNKVKVPANFDRFNNKESLFEAVKKGLRPERPQKIDQQCWDLIVRCWHQDPAKRPLPGEIEEVLADMKEKAVLITQHNTLTANVAPDSMSSNVLVGGASGVANSLGIVNL